MRIIVWLILIGFVVPDAYAQRGQFDKTPVNAADERIVVTPPGFTVPGRIAAPPGEMAARLEVNVLDSATGRPIACRVNVVGPDGNYYHPADHPLSPYSLTGNWPEQGQGNRLGKAPIRYFGHFFYSTGRFSVDAPAGAVRVEVWKGFEYAPQSVNTELRAGDTKRVEVRLTRAIDAPKLGYWSGDPHLHFPRGADSEDQLIFDLLSAEDIRYGVVMCYNETNAYSGTMAQLVMPQLRGLGRRSIAERDQQQII
ncbi:MAG: hypothetical protein FJX63_10710, partial [Alphaproteobacteria bacterium]|nr:hypothetical protein [Alphaproteobacteria bacterium]